MYCQIAENICTEEDEEDFYDGIMAPAGKHSPYCSAATDCVVSIAGDRRMRVSSRSVRSETTVRGNHSPEKVPRIFSLAFQRLDRHPARACLYLFIVIDEPGTLARIGSWEFADKKRGLVPKYDVPWRAWKQA